jgi:hypothetical protein
VIPWYIWAVVAVTVLSSLAQIAMIGRPRDPITPGVAIVSLIINGLCIWAILAGASQ